MTVNPGLRVVNEFVDELWRAGVRHVCVSPGSRSTPLTMAFARRTEYSVWNLLDERSAGFFALGLARQSRTPVVLVCTSGTAAANYLPAVIEAFQSGVPLIVLTADRPPELRHVGSNQTVDQLKLYGTHVKWFAEMPIPDGSTRLSRHARATAWRLVAIATTVPRGPVHLNWPFREPLIPPLWSEEGSVGPEGAPVSSLTGLRSDETQGLSDDNCAALAQMVQRARRGLIVCGPQEDPEFAAAVTLLAAAWDVPVVADALSQLRTGPHDKSRVIDGYDVFLRCRALWPQLAPDLILRFGGTPTSKILGQFLEQCAGARQVVVSETPHWKDPLFTATHFVEASPAAFCRSLAERLSVSTESGWCAEWKTCDETTHLEAQGFARDDLDFEGRLFVELSDLLPDGSVLFAGNSMPVRDLDAFFPKRERPVHILANRGASGIDGVVSSALGVAAVHKGTVVLVIGDVSFYHDLNGLLAAHKYGLRIIVVLVNNDGGGIFSFLPQAEHPDTFEHFRTSHGLDFAPVVDMYGGTLFRPRNWTEFRDMFNAASTLDSWSLLELRVDGPTNVKLHKAFYERVEAALGGRL